MILMVVLGFHFLLYLVALMVSMFSRCNLCMRSCSGVRCHLMRHFAEFRTGLYNGCVGGSVANRRAALCLILLAKIWNGSVGLP